MKRYFIVLLAFFGLIFLFLLKLHTEPLVEIKYITSCLPGYNYSFKYNISHNDHTTYYYLLLLTYKYPKNIQYKIINNTIKIIEETFENDTKYRYEKCFRKVLIVIRSDKNYTIEWYKKWRNQTFFNYAIRT